MENIDFYARIDKNKIAQVDENALRDLNYTKSFKKRT